LEGDACWGTAAFADAAGAGVVGAGDCATLVAKSSSKASPELAVNVVPEISI